MASMVVVFCEREREKKMLMVQAKCIAMDWQTNWPNLLNTDDNIDVRVY